MASKNRFHIDDVPETSDTPRHLTKQEFGRRIYSLMIQKGWNQSELARRAGIPRDSVSTYVRGRSFPTPKSLHALAKALGVATADILPNSIESAIDQDAPSLEMKVSTSAPDAAWLRVNRLVTLRTAARVIEMIQTDRVGRDAEASDTD